MRLINSDVIFVTYPGVRELVLNPGGQLIFLAGHNSICPGHINRNYCDTVAYYAFYDLFPASNPGIFSFEFLLFQFAREYFLFFFLKYDFQFYPLWLKAQFSLKGLWDVSFLEYRTNHHWPLERIQSFLDFELYPVKDTVDFWLW